MNSIASYFVFLLAAFYATTVSAQLVVNTASTAQQLIEDVLVGPGVEVSNFQFTGNAATRGTFDGTNSNIGLSSGVIICTGRVSDAVGPNGTPTSDDGTDLNEAGYPQLAAISGSPQGTFDAAILEFDFVPSSDTVRFRYVFASNEYMLYVGAEANDVFAFFISGPGF
ncbi:MAG: choice-of-anchor L domain-containing protein, partial [Flavobacteriales bacterium]|nr:choice-of-anchor L domain-containing protein [Flavobacteriales bacterium]